MAVDQQIIDRIALQIEEIIKDETPDYKIIDYHDFHTHTIDDIPQLLLMFNSGYINSIYDKYYDKLSRNGYILYSNNLLINFGQFQYNNNLLETEVLLPLSYSLKHEEIKYSLQFNRVIESEKFHTVIDPIDIGYDIIITSKTNSSFIVKSPQLYIPERFKYNYFTIGMIDK